MAKDPAFLFYSKDWVEGTTILSFEDRGKYIHLLSIMHQQGRLDEETICFLVGSVSVKLKSKFLIDEKGLWYNERLEKEAEKRNKFTESRISNGKKGGRPKTYDKPSGKPYGKAKNNLGVNANGDVNKDVIKKKRKEKIEFDPGVKMTQEEWDKLSNEFGQEVTKKATIYLSSYKIEKDYKTKSDYLTILRWVIGAVQKQTNGSSQTANPARKGGRNQGTYDFVNETAAEYFAIHGRTHEGEIQRPEDKGVGE